MIGESLSHYRIVARLGEGGMGEVYRAEDTKLGREVAIKVLPQAFVADPERLARFEREAKALAAVNHPNIAAIYGLETADDKQFLVLELVEGETLEERTADGPTPLAEALLIGRQIAEALEAAHDRGIVHRDLKPANIKVTPEGKVKVLDFGLAKAYGGELISPDITQSPTLTQQMTQAGVLLGTAAYMSPEQARGQAVDKRADIWAFGCVLYEMLTGKQAFPGGTVTDILAAIVQNEPHWSLLPADTPARTADLLRRCLRKDPHQRLHDIADARIELEETSAPKEIPDLAPATSRRGGWRQALPWGLAALLALAVVALAWRLLINLPGAAPHPVRFAVQLPADRWLAGRETIALTPDGAALAFVAEDGQSTRLYLRRMDRLEATPIPGTDGAENPFFSPDGKWVGFTARRKLMKISTEGGTPVTLCDAEWGGGAWGTDDSIIFTPSYAEGLWRVSAAGGTPQRLTTPDLSQGELGHFWPQLLPGSKAVVFTSFSPDLKRSRVEIYVPASGERRTLVEGGVFGRYTRTGHLLYVRAETLMAVPFDPVRLEVAGSPVPVLEDVPIDVAQGDSPLAFSDNGSLAYVPASTVRANRVLMWVDRQGREQPVMESPRRFLDARLSPGGRRLALTIDEGGWDVWVYGLQRGTLSRLTFEATSEFNPLWTPDGGTLIFNLDRPPYDIYRMAADSSGPPQPLLATEYDKVLSSVSPDGELVAFNESHPETAADIWLLPLQGDHEARPFRRTPFAESFAVFSPDGAWIAYQSDESGRNEIYAQAYPGPGGKFQVSIDGGTEPLWAPDGKEIFFRNRDQMMSVPVNTSPEFKAGEPRLLFEGRYDRFNLYRGYDVASDGRFLMIKTPEESLPRQLNVVVNWFEELERLAPTSR